MSADMLSTKMSQGDLAQSRAVVGPTLPVGIVLVFPKFLYWTERARARGSPQVSLL